jgi:hypothetical protein
MFKSKLSFRSKLLAAMTTLTLVGGAGATSLATAGAANAATPSCGPDCVSIFSHNFGTFTDPGFTLDVYKRLDQIGAPVILFRASNSDPALDWTIAEQGTVNDFFQAGLVSAAVNLHYGGGGCLVYDSKTQTCKTRYPNFEAYELAYSPYGADSGYCAGLATTAQSGEKVSLQPCGVSAKTVWVADYADSPATISVPLISGSDNNFSHPEVLTYPSGASPTDHPRPQLYVSPLTGFSTGTGPEIGTVDDNQLWAWVTGVLS